jgi:DNA-binding CsgD family transcriptional regulator
MAYISVRQAAEKWGVSVRQVQALIKNNRIKGAVRFDNHAWSIPADAEKPGDPRTENKQPPIKSLSAELAEIIAATTVPMPEDNPDAILGTLNDRRISLQYEGELAYLRGDFEKVKRGYREIGDDDAAKIRACSLTIAAAISTGDYPLYTEVETYLTSIINANKDARVKTFAELMFATAHTGAFAPNMVPDWLKDGDFSALSHEARLDAVYKRIKYFQMTGQYKSMLAAAQTALSFCDTGRGINLLIIYLKGYCVVAYCILGHADEAKRLLSDVLKIALPHGFITPFAELVTMIGGLLEQALEREYPEYYETVINQNNRTHTNWLAFHNRFTKNNITLILSPREYQIAILAVRGVPFKKIAEQFHISLGTLNNNMQIIYQKLSIKGKKDLHKFIL